MQPATAPHVATCSDARRRRNARLAVVAAALLWSSSGFFARSPIFTDWAQVDVGPLLAFWRATFAALVLLPAIRKPRWHWLLIPLTLCFAAMNVSYLTAVIRTTPANAIWLQSAAPWWVFLVSTLLLREPVVRRELIPLAFGLLGVGLILVCEFTVTATEDKTGVLCGVASGVFYAGVILFMRQLRTQNAAWLIALSHLVAALVLVPWVVGLGVWPSAAQFAVLAAFGVFQMAVPYLLVLRGLRTISAQETVAIGLIEPVFMPLWAYIAWGVGSSWWTFAGAVLILTGLVLRYTTKISI